MKQLSIKRKGSISPGVQASKQCRLVEDDTEGKFPVVTFYCVFTLFWEGGGGGAREIGLRNLCLVMSVIQKTF